MMQYGGGGLPDFLRQLIMQMYAGGLGQSYGGGFGQAYGGIGGSPQMPRSPMQRPTARPPQRQQIRGEFGFPAGPVQRPADEGIRYHGGLPPRAPGGVPFAGPSNRIAPSFSTPPLPGSDGLSSRPAPGDPIALTMGNFSRFGG